MTVIRNSTNPLQTDTQLTPTTPQPPTTLALQQPEGLGQMPLTPEDGSVLKKIVSFTVEKIHSENATAKLSRPSYVPEKLNFSAYERFEGELSSFFKI